MKNYQAVYYRDPRGAEPVNDAIDGLPPPHQESVDWTIGLLNELNDERPHLPFPYSSALKGKDYRAFRELRCDCGSTHHRIIFRRSRRLLVLLHMIVDKRTGEISEGDKKIAVDRWNDFVARMDSIPRGNPRAIGRDAP